MTYVDAYWDRARDLVKVVERDPTLGRIYKEYPAKYEFYYKNAKGKYTSIYGESLARVHCKTHKEFVKEIKSYGSQQLYESDINSVHRCLEEYYLNQEPPSLNVAFFDIETDMQPYAYPSQHRVRVRGRRPLNSSEEQEMIVFQLGQLVKKEEYEVFDEVTRSWDPVIKCKYLDAGPGYAPPDDAFMPITAISIYLQWIDTLVCLAVPPKTLSMEEAIKLVEEFPNTFLFDTEKEMLDVFLNVIEDADVLSGWNSEGYDIPYTVNRIIKTLSKNDSRRMCLWDQYPKRREYERFGKTTVTYDLVGRVHLDSLELYRKYTYEERHSYRLDAIGEMELGENKTTYEGTLDQLYNNDFKRFIEYNRQDTALLGKLDKKLKFIELASAIAHENTVLLPTVLGAVAVTEQAVINEAHRLGVIVPSRVSKDEKGETQAAGAYVAYPKKGLHDWVGSVDINSLYPSAIRALNMSPETIIGQLRQTATTQYIQTQLSKGKSFAGAWEGLFSSLEYEKVMKQDRAEEIHVDWVNGQTDVMTGAQIYETLFEKNTPWMISANGTIFTYEKEGIIPGLLERWYSERKQMQKKLGEASEAGDKSQEEYWDKRQLVKKILLNSVYGALLNPGCRFFDQRIGQSTTLTGRSITKHMSATINEIITGEYDHLGICNIYGDTDSSFFSAYPALKKDIDLGKLEWNKDNVIKFYDAVADETNSTFANFMETAFHVPQSRGQVIKAGRELVATKGLFITKKRYAMLYYDKEKKRVDKDNALGKVKATGLDLKRSDTPPYMQKFLEEILIMILTGAEQTAVLDRIKDFRTEFKARPGWEKGTPKRANNIASYKTRDDRGTKVSVPGHVRASINWNTLKQLNGDRYSMEIVDGMKVVVCKLKDNPMRFTSVAYPTDELRLPKWFQDLPFDHDAMESTIINNKLENLIGVLDYDLESTQQNSIFSNLFTFN
jgi:DNA polymerase elongation subunit (family B)